VAQDGVKLFRVTDEVYVNSIDILGDKVDVVDDVTKVGSEDEPGDLVAKAGQLLVSRLEGSLGLAGKVQNENRLVDLDSLGTSFLELGKELLVNRDKLIKQVDGVNLLATVCLAQVEEGYWANKHRSRADAGLLGLCELSDSLGVGAEREGLVVLEGRLDVVVVRVEPLDHLQAGDIYTTLLMSTAHGEVFIYGVEVRVAVALGHGLEKYLVSNEGVTVGEDVGSRLTPKSWM
jgi:hypothetical protein